jgi:nucleoside-diphosphate-sugar epimerase
MGDNILVTGGTGFIGGELARALLAGGQHVRLLGTRLRRIVRARACGDRG